MTLVLTYSDLRRELGRFLRLGRDPDSWTDEERVDVDDIIKSGLRSFVTPPVMPPARYSHQWSFLMQQWTLTTVSGQYEYDLPTNFAMLDGAPTYAPGTNTLYPPLILTGEFVIRQKLQMADATSRPGLCALIAKSPITGGGTTWALLVYPTPDDAYEITVRYKLDPESLSGDLSLPLGGPPHAETIKEACLAAAERTLLDEPGVHAAEYLTRLAASISHDQQASSPASLGRICDTSDQPIGASGDWRRHSERVVTYNGIEY